MDHASRRTFLSIAGVGAAAAGAAVAIPSALARPAGAAPAGTALPAGASGSIAAFVHDVRRGEVTVMVEGREVLVTDHELVARLATAIASLDGDLPGALGAR